MLKFPRFARRSGIPSCRLAGRRISSSDLVLVPVPARISSSDLVLVPVPARISSSDLVLVPVPGHPGRLDRQSDDSDGVTTQTEFVTRAARSPKWRLRRDGDSDGIR